MDMCYWEIFHSDITQIRILFYQQILWNISLRFHFIIIQHKRGRIDRCKSLRFLSLFKSHNTTRTYRELTNKKEAYKWTLRDCLVLLQLILIQLVFCLRFSCRLFHEFVWAALRCNVWLHTQIVHLLRTLIPFSCRFWNHICAGCTSTSYGSELSQGKSNWRKKEKQQRKRWLLWILLMHT